MTKESTRRGHVLSGRPTDQKCDEDRKSEMVPFFLGFVLVFLLFGALVAAGEEERFLRAGDALLSLSGFARSPDVCFPGVPDAPLVILPKAIQLSAVDPSSNRQVRHRNARGVCVTQRSTAESRTVHDIHPNHPCFVFREGG